MSYYIIYKTTTNKQQYSLLKYLHIIYIMYILNVIYVSKIGLKKTWKTFLLCQGLIKIYHIICTAKYKYYLCCKQT